MKKLNLDGQLTPYFLKKDLKGGRQMGMLLAKLVIASIDGNSECY